MSIQSIPFNNLKCSYNHLSLKKNINNIVKPCDDDTNNIVKPCENNILKSCVAYFFYILFHHTEKLVYLSF